MAAAVVSSLMSILGTWYFARRRFDKTPGSERNELTGYQKFLLLLLAIFGAIVVFVLGLVAAFAWLSMP